MFFNLFYAQAKFIVLNEMGEGPLFVPEVSWHGITQILILLLSHPPPN